eukprot:gene10401-21686_t
MQLSSDAQVTVAGAFAGVIGTILGFPFDTIKTKMQTSQGEYSSMSQAFRKVIRNEGIIGGLYRGVGSPLIALTALNMLNFSNYATFKEKLGVDNDHKGTGFDYRIVIAGAASGPLASIISTPFEFIKTQMQLSKKMGFAYKNSFQAAVHISQKYGILSLYTGHIVNTTREIIFLGTYFGIYEHSKSCILSLFPNQIAIPIAGGLSGAIGWFISFPLDCIKSNIQGHSPDVLMKSKQKMMKVAMMLYRTQGIAGLYQGLLPSVVRAFLVSSSRFSAYESALWALS